MSASWPTQAAHSYPKSAVVLCGFGRFYIEQGGFEEAGKLWEQAVASDPTCVEALGNLGNLYRQMGRAEEAKAMWEKALVVTAIKCCTLSYCQFIWRIIIWASARWRRTTSAR